MCIDTVAWVINLNYINICVVYNSKYNHSCRVGGVVCNGKKPHSLKIYNNTKQQTLLSFFFSSKYFFQYYQ